MSRGRGRALGAPAPAGAPENHLDLVERTLTVRPQFGPLRAFILCAPPGSGKSHLSAALSERFGAVPLASDAMRKTLGWRPDDFRVFEVAEQLSERLIGRGVSVVLDYNSARRRQRTKASKRVAALGAEPVIIWVDTPPQIRHARLAERQTRELAAHEVIVPDEVVERMDERFIAPQADEGALRIDGSADPVAQLKQLLGPVAPRPI